MEKEFVPYSLALELKELGFGSAYWIGGYQGGKVFYYEKGELYYDGRPMYSSDAHSGQIEAPLYQQVLRWFREKHNLGNYIFPKRANKETKWKYQILFLQAVSENHLAMQLEPSKCLKSYEEAELECLKKLIEIVKNDIQNKKELSQK